MSIRARAYTQTIVAFLILISAELIFIQIFIRYGLSWLMFIVGPISLMVITLVWLSKITGTKCNQCHNLYGVNVDSTGWPSIPDQCQSCGK